MAIHQPRRQSLWMYRLGNLLEPVAHLLLLGAIAVVLSAVVLSFVRMDFAQWVAYQQLNWQLSALMLIVPMTLAGISMLMKWCSGLPLKSKRMQRADVGAIVATVVLIAGAIALMSMAHANRWENFATGLILAVASAMCVLGALLVTGLWLAFRNTD
jgi:hypothetical protein